MPEQGADPNARHGAVHDPGRACASEEGHRSVVTHTRTGHADAPRRRNNRPSSAGHAEAPKLRGPEPQPPIVGSSAGRPGAVARSRMSQPTPRCRGMLTTGLNDPRVASWQAGKMAARLIEAGSLAFLRIDEAAGHGMGSTRSARDAEEADIAAFALWRAGVPEWQPRQ